ncbi:schlafen family member 5 [Pteronotus mesoamericanus]|uniref:schlafen family member 5 n=1 Tax=Pteronotus mesoamericanus TaxID=1884717 RepID=UPI0023EBD939|nr:schlafen family member 5 [Pteronotus parnellii mesoamericanus]
MNLKVDLETNFADYVVNVGKVILGNKKRNEVDPCLRKTQDDIISRAVCALLNSGGGVVQIEIENKNYNYARDGVGLNEHPVFRGYLDEMQKEDNFFIFVKSWDAKSSGVRLATLCSNLYHRHRAFTDVMSPQDALAFLRRKSQPLMNTNIHNSLLLSPQNVEDGVQSESSIKASAAALFDRTHLQYLEKLNFTKSTHVELKMFSAEVSKCFSESLPSCVSAFANTEGGYIFWGVHDETLQVIGCEKGKIQRGTLSDSISSCIRKLPVHHFCTQKRGIKYAIKFIEVHKQRALHGYVCAVKVERFCCAVFAKEPSSWQVKDSYVRQLATKEWVAWMTETDPDLSRFSEMLLELSLSSTTPRSRSVCTHKNLECLEEQQKRYFPVSSDSVMYRPQSLYKELFSQHKGLRFLINKQMRLVSQGVLIFSQSWAVDVGLSEHQGVICDALLLSKDKRPTLYTIFREHGMAWKDYCMKVACALKLKLVNTGGYTGKLCIVPFAFLLDPDGTSRNLCISELQEYPESYTLTTTQQMEALLQSLVIVLRGFRSFLSEELGSEVLNLLTDKQYELLSKNFHKTRELFVHGLPGSGKTILALKVMEKIRNVFLCQPGDILYICENKPLQDFVSHKNICQAVTRKTFMKTNSNFEKIRHIIIDEAQNFRLEDGDWYTKAKTIMQRDEDCPGILWIFLDYFQTSHLEFSGLPRLKDQYPREELTRVVRNADPIAKYLQEIVGKVRENPPPNIPARSLKMLREVEWAQGVPGNLEITEYSDLEQIVVYIKNKCQFLLKNGYSHKDIAVLCSKASDVHKYKPKLQRAMRKRESSELSEESYLFIRFEKASNVTGDHIVFDSVRRFSGLERNIVFGIDPSFEPALFHNLLLCLASRARKHLYILKISN